MQEEQERVELDTVSQTDTADLRYFESEEQAQSTRINFNLFVSL